MLSPLHSLLGSKASRRWRRYCCSHLEARKWFLGSLWKGQAITGSRDGDENKNTQKDVQFCFNEDFFPSGPSVIPAAWSTEAFRHLCLASLNVDVLLEWVEVQQRKGLGARKLLYVAIEFLVISLRGEKWKLFHWMLALIPFHRCYLPSRGPLL